MKQQLRCGEGEASGPHRPPVHYKSNESFHAQEGSGQWPEDGIVCSWGTWGAYAWSDDKGQGQKGEMVLVQFACG